VGLVPDMVVGVCQAARCWEKGRGERTRKRNGIIASSNYHRMKNLRLIINWTAILTLFYFTPTHAIDTVYHGNPNNLLRSAIVNCDCYVSETVNENCMVNYDKKLNHSFVLISGIEKCLGNNPHYFYEIQYNKKPYYVEIAHLTTKDSTFEKIDQMSDSEKQDFKKMSIMVSEALYNKDATELKKMLNKGAKAGLSIIDWEVTDESEYTQGTGFSIRVLNSSSKVIKYVWINVSATNRVGDKIVTKGSSIITVKGMGPMNPGSVYTLSKEYAWFTDLVERANIVSIKVQYMDGSIKNIAKPKDVIIPKNYMELLFDSN
jgi:hypothetical protein